MAGPNIATAAFCALVCLQTGGAVGAYADRPSEAEAWIEAGHWKRARTEVEARIRLAPNDPLANFQLSQIRAAFGDRSTPLPLAEKAVALDGRTARYHRQVAEVLGVLAQHANALQQILLARRFRKEIDTALALDPRDVQANRDLLEFSLLAPGVAGGSRQRAGAVADRICAIELPEGLLAKARIASFDRQPDLEESLLRKASEAQPARYRARIALAEFQLAHAGMPAAEAAARDALRLDPGRADAYAVLAALYADRGDWAELDAVLAGAEREVPDDLYPEFRAADRLLAGGRHADRAERYLRAYLAQEPEGSRPTAAEASRQLARALDLRRKLDRNVGRTERALP
jgi:tetratricopeptide (TPR) repeat protein